MKKMKKLLLRHYVLLIIILASPQFSNAQSGICADCPNVTWIKIRPGMAFTALDPNIFGKPTVFNQSLNYNLGFSKTINKKFGIDLDLEYRKMDLVDALKKRYNFIDINSFVGQNPFSRIKIGNAILSMDYKIYSKNEKSILDFSIGGGYQRIHRGNTILAFSNPHRLGALDTVYHAGGKTNGLLAQLGIHYTWFPTNRLGIQMGVRAQYNGTYTTVKYNTVTADANGKINSKDYCNCETVTSSTIDRFVGILEIGIVLRTIVNDKKK